MKQYDNINNGLLGIIPPTSTNILELGCSGGRLAEVFKSIHPTAKWTGVDFSARSLSAAIKRMDEVVLMDLNNPKISDLPYSDYDTIVMGDVLEHLSNPIDAMKFSYDVSTPDAQVSCCMPIMTNVGIIERMLMGDLSYDEYGLLDSTHLRFMSVASTVKLFLDSGWLPKIEATKSVGVGNGSQRDIGFINLLIDAAEFRGINRSVAERNLYSYQILVTGTKIPKTSKNNATSFTVIVPVDNSTSYELNIGRSPGLKEVDAQIIPLYNMTNEDTFIEGCKQATNKWILFCSQDMYIPEGSGYLLSNIFNNSSSDTLFGFDGIVKVSNNDNGFIVAMTHEYAFKEKIRQNEFVPLFHNFIK
jgi:SAM-dependent methyltransferase